MAISTHVLNAMTGRPAAGMAVRLQLLSTAGESAAELVPDRVTSERVTDAEGRVRDLCADSAPGVYRLSFATGAYFAGLNVATFYPEVAITVQISDPAQHYHVPLLLSPYAYSTYRGS